MFRAATALSTDTESAPAAEAASREALGRLGTTPELALCFATPHHRAEYPAILRAIQKVTGVERIIGCSSSGVIANNHEIEREAGIALALLSGDEFLSTPFFLHGLTYDGAAAGAAFVEHLQPHIASETTAVIFPDPFGFAARDFFESIERSLGFHPIVGGAASGGERARKTYQLCGTEVDSHALTGFLLDGRLDVRVGLTQGCLPIGLPLTITKAEGNVVSEIAGRPALERLRESLTSIEMPEPQRLSGSVFAGIAIDPSKEHLDRGDYLVRNIVGIDPQDGRLALADRVRPGQTLQFQLHDGPSAEEDIRRMLKELTADDGSPSPVFGLYINCSGRGHKLFETPSHDARMIRDAFGEIPLVGFFGNAEFAPVGTRNLMHHYTGVLLLIGAEA